LRQVRAVIPTLPHQSQFANSGIHSLETFKQAKAQGLILPERYTGLVGGFGSGKSLAVPLRTINLLRYRQVLGQRGDILILAPTDGLLSEINIPDMEEFLDHYKIRWRYKPKSKARIIEVLTPQFAGLIRFKSAHVPERIVGFNCSDFIIDEFDIIPYKNQKTVWIKCLARIRKAYGATGAIATTPEGFKYTYELFEDGIGEEGQKKTVGPLIRAKTTDNIFLPADYIASLQAIYDPLLLKQYMAGEFVNINGASAYYMFNRDDVVIPWSLVKPSTIHLSVDFNVDPLTASAWTRDGQTSIQFDEFFIRNSYTERLIEVVKTRFPTEQILCYPDMTGIKRETKRSGGASKSDIGLLRNAGFTIKGTRNPLVRDRLACVNNAFSQGLVKIMDNCTYAIRDYEQVTKDKYGEIDKPSGTLLTHMSDNGGYYLSRTYPIMKSRSVQL